MEPTRLRNSLPPAGRRETSVCHRQRGELYGGTTNHSLALSTTRHWAHPGGSSAGAVARPRRGAGGKSAEMSPATNVGTSVRARGEHTGSSSSSYLLFRGCGKTPGRWKKSLHALHLDCLPERGPRPTTRRNTRSVRTAGIFCPHHIVIQYRMNLARRDHESTAGSVASM